MVKKYTKIHSRFRDGKILGELMWKKEKCRIPYIECTASTMKVEYSGLEPLTSTLPVLRSSQMS